MVSKSNLVYGLFALLVLSIGLASADLANMDLYILGSGNSTATPVAGLNGSTQSFNVRLNHSDSALGDVNVSWSGGSGYVALPAASNASVGINTFPMSITMPSTILESSRILTATFTYFNGTVLGTEAVTVYYNSTAPAAPTTPTGYEFCNWNGTKGFENGSDLEIRSVQDNKLDNDKEWEWRPLDNIELEVKVKNDGDSDEDYVVEIVFLDGDKNTVDVADDEDALEEEVSIDEGESETIVFNFAVDGDIDSGSYDMYVKVYQDGDEKKQCVSQGPGEGDVEDITIKKDKHDVIVKTVTGMNSVKAGSLVTYEVTVANLGREDEDQVKIWVSNSNLGINEFIEIEELDSGDSETVTFNVKYPVDANEGAYKLKFSTEFNYDEDDDTYKDESAEEDDYTLSVGVLTGGAVEPTVGASLESEAKIGEELVVKATVKNNGANGNFVISASGYEAWADLVSVTPQTAELAKGETAEVMITLVPKTSGLQSFSVNTIAGGETYSQSVSVNIPAKNGNLFGDTNPMVVYLIGGIIVLIVIILLVLIFRLASRPKRKVSDY
jgi:hypothetical protein